MLHSQVQETNSNTNLIPVPYRIYTDFNTDTSVFFIQHTDIKFKTSYRFITTGDLCKLLALSTVVTLRTLLQSFYSPNIISMKLKSVNF